METGSLECENRTNFQGIIAKDKVALATLEDFLSRLLESAYDLGFTVTAPLRKREEHAQLGAGNWIR
jgi:hypothetical protein